MLVKILSFLIVAGAATVLLITTTTQPSQVGPTGILMLFVSLYLVVMGVMTFAIHGSSRLMARFSRSANFRRPIEVMPMREAYFYGTITALGPVMLVGMQSVGAVGVYEFGLVLLFTVLGCVYISKKTS